METHLLAMQARILQWIGLSWLAYGVLWLGQDPLTVAWRAAIGAFIAMWVGGRLLRMVAKVIEERMAIEAADAQLAAEQAAAAAATPAGIAAMAKKNGLG